MSCPLIFVAFSSFRLQFQINLFKFIYWFSFYSNYIAQLLWLLQFFSPRFVIFAPLVRSYYFGIRTSFHFFCSIPLCQSRSYLLLIISFLPSDAYYSINFSFQSPDYEKKLWSARVYCFHFPGTSLYRLVMFVLSCCSVFLWRLGSFPILFSPVCNWSCNLLYIAHSCHEAWSVELACWRISDVGYRICKILKTGLIDFMRITC